LEHVQYFKFRPMLRREQKGSLYRTVGARRQVCRNEKPLHTWQSQKPLFKYAADVANGVDAHQQSTRDVAKSETARSSSQSIDNWRSSTHA
jgi:hypothetical protein